MNHPSVIQFRSSLSLFKNSSTDFTVIILKTSTTPARFCTVCCNICLSISASYIANRSRFASFSAISFSSIAFFTSPFNDSRSEAILSLSKFNYSITIVKLISGLEKFCLFRQLRLGNKNIPTIVPRLSSSSLPSVALLNLGARIALNNILTPRYNSL